MKFLRSALISLVIILMVTTPSSGQSSGQWSGSTTTTGEIYRAGGVKLGTGSASDVPLAIGKYLANESTDSRNVILEIGHDATWGTSNKPKIGIRIGRIHPDYNERSVFLGYQPAGSYGGSPEFFIENGTTEVLRIDKDGKLYAKEIVVQSSWADFVFEDDYKLLTLAEVQEHIETYGRLPDIPSAQEVDANGVSLGQMDATLLQKIEELTIYTIAQEEQIDELTAQNQLLLHTLEQVQERLTTLEGERQ